MTIHIPTAPDTPALWADVRALLDPLDAAPVECDGFVRLAHTRLVDAGIPHECRRGSLATDNRTLHHWWIALEDGATVDYRARLWFGDDAPHGVFTDTLGFRYVGGLSVGVALLPPRLFALLASPVPAGPGGQS